MDSNSLRQWQNGIRLSDDAASNELGLTQEEFLRLKAGNHPLSPENAQRLEVRIALRAPAAGPAVVQCDAPTFGTDGRFDLSKKNQYETNEAALEAACELLAKAPNSPVRITSKSGEILWSFVALRAECARRSSARAQIAI